MRIYRSMRGELIDVDLIKIKSELSVTAKTPAVLQRESYVKGKRKRISRKKIEEMINKATPEVPITDKTKNVSLTKDATSIAGIPSSDDNDSLDTPIDESNKKTNTPIKTIKRDRKHESNSN